MIGKSREDLVLTPLTARSANASVAAAAVSTRVPASIDRRAGKFDEANESLGRIHSKEFNTSIQADNTQDEEDWYDGKAFLDRIANRR